MSYTVKFTDYTNKGALTVNDTTFNTDTSLAFPGRNQRGYGITVAENFLHLLENFANSSEPINPVEGQIWYDNTPGVEDLKIYDGTVWKSAGSVRKNNTEPDGVLGDLWVDTDNQQLYLFNGATWILVGPTFSSGLKTGVQAETILDAAGNNKVVLKTYIDDEVAAIFSISTFVPKTSIEGFSTIRPGINLSTKSGDKKFYGISEKAEALLIGTNAVAAANFLRKDTSNITNYGFTLRNDNGLSVGNESQLRFSVDSGQAGNIYLATPDAAFDVRVNRNGEITTLIRADSSTGNIGIGENNLAPEETLDVSGTAKISGVVKITSTEDTINDATGALRVAGGANIQKSLIVRGNANFDGHIIVGEIGGGDIAILSTQDSTFDIGSSANKFKRIYANTTYSNLVGNVTGNVTGNVNGTATSLVSSTTFAMDGDVSSTTFSFDGSTGGNTKTFTTSIASDFITTKTEVTSVDNTDELLVYRPGNGLRKMARTTFFKEVATMPIGAILPFAGISVPTGYLLCDGSEKQRAKYPDLYDVIGYTYGDPGLLLGVGTFRVPDLRGRFPLGRDNMDNADSVPEAATSGITNIDSGGGPAGRVNNATANSIGNANGAEQTTLNVENLPDHKHDFIGDAGGQFYATNNSSGIPQDTNAILGNGPSAAGQGQYITNTGSMITDTSYDVAVNLMNPYLTINYIIYVGRIVS
jgi:microcystin-dependent protein